MKKKYLSPFLCIFLLLAVQVVKSQEIESSEKQIDTIEGLSVYPNPATGDKIYITSSLGLTKQVKIFDVLGEQILFKVLVGKELNISELNSGVYYIEITEQKFAQQLKLIVTK